MKIFKFIITTFLTALISVGIFGFSFAFAAGIGIDPLLRPDNAPTITGDTTDLSGSQEVRQGRDVVEYGENFVRLTLMQRITGIILGIAGVLAVFFIMNNAFSLVISGGKEETVTQHKKGLMWSVIGLILIILSYSIIRFVITLSFSTNEQPAPTPAAQTESGSAGSVTPPSQSGRQGMLPIDNSMRSD